MQGLPTTWMNSHFRINVVVRTFLIIENDMHIIFVTPKTNSCHCKKGFEPLLRAH